MDYSALFETLTLSRPGQHELVRSGLATLARLATDLLANGRGVALVVRDRDELMAARALMTLFSPTLSMGESTAPTSQRETVAEGALTEGESALWVSLPPFTARSANREGWAERLAALYALSHGRARGVILTADNLLARLVPLDFFAGQSLRLVQGEELSPDMLIEQVVEWGYERVPMVANPGEVARRGDIVDILPPGYDFPLRLDFFGDLLEEIRLFNPASQRSRGTLPVALLVPVHPVRRDKPGIQRIEARWKRLFQKGLLTESEQTGLFRLLEQHDFRLLPGAAYDASTVLEEWLPKDTVWLLPGRHDVRDALQAGAGHWRTAFETWCAEGRDEPGRLALRSPEEAETVWSARPVVHAEPLVMGMAGSGVDLQERQVASFSSLFPLPAEQDRPWQTLVQALKKWQGSRRQVLLAFVSERSRRKFLQLAEQDALFPALRYDPQGKGLFALVAPFRSGADLVWDDVLVLGEDVLQPHAEKTRRVPSGAFRGLDRHDELRPGDLLVHRDYGIGRFDGLQRMELGGVSNDFLLIQYAGDDKLYVPVDRLALIQRFKGGSEALPPLDRLGGGGWQSGKEKARKAIEKVAEDLMEMYAWRKVAKGFQYGALGEMYREFEASFGFEETPDQSSAIQDVLADMDKPVPMDRLVCGDVGFGKTEVALRAAFRAASEGRQVALLCPTTILAEQHYQTFRSRLAGFALNVGLLSRFVSTARQKEVLKAAATGRLDILIGTHRLLSDDVVLPNLGLMILDEEQRFGVRHKEKLKKLKRNVDALTLTATPIPRTLQLSISGVRELSVIETAPPERKPVATALIERDKGPLRQILERELAREGQIFWVHNRVQGLERVVDYVRELVPTARIGMAHGQMAEKALEETMHKFWHGELDVLVCTAIVESGLDFPRANTLVVDEAQMFGLGQLYQLRGRVGRSDRQAFAAFVVSDLDRLSTTAKERMRIILDLDYLGAGFQVAMEDLRLRGAGNILGEVQSGHMTRVGIELYLEMLEEAVNRIKGGSVPVHTEPEINLGLTAHIPETYIADSHERLRWYKRLTSSVDAAAREELELELRDRYGALPEALQTFLAVLHLKSGLGRLQVLRADIHSDRLRVSWDEKQTAVAPESVLGFLQRHAQRARFMPPSTLDLRLDTTRDLPERLGVALQLLRELEPAACGESATVSPGHAEPNQQEARV